MSSVPPYFVEIIWHAAPQAPPDAQESAELLAGRHEKFADAVATAKRRLIQLFQETDENGKPTYAEGTVSFRIVDKDRREVRE